MRARIQQRAYCDWPGDIRRRLMALTLRDCSGMREAIQNNNSLITFVLFERKNPVAWSLVQWDHTEFNVMIYVRRDKRLLGYGRRVFTKAKQWVQAKGRKHYIFPDMYNYKFFKQIGEKVPSRYEV